jgi:carboxyl-terminal processing protease
LREANFLAEEFSMMKKNQWLVYVRTGLVVLTLMLGVGAGVVLDRGVLVAKAAPSAVDIGPDFKLISEAWDKIQANYVDQSAEQTKPMTYGAISGMVTALGDTGHTTFLTPEMIKSQNSYTRGSFEGIGAQVGNKNGHVVIIAPLDNSPAQKAGLRADQVILKVNGDSVDGLPVDQVVSRILGPAGTSVTLTIFDPINGQTTDIPIVRARIAVNNVTWQFLPGTNIAHLRLAGFSQGVSRQMQLALTDMQQQGATGVILDLRNNPGGLLTEAVNTTSQFLATGDVLLEKNAQGVVTHVSVRGGGAGLQLPMVVLVNAGSASASEIVAGALQDAGRAKLIGEKTFGTGTVLNQFPLSDGSALMLAIEEWLTPKGRVIWHTGIVPDQTVALASGVNALTPEGERTMTLEQLRASGDQQLLGGLSALSKSAFLAPPNTTAMAAPGFSSGAVDAAPLALELELLKALYWI